MFGSTPIIRRLAGLAVVAGAFAALVPVAQADSGFQGEHDAVDPVAALQRAQQSATFDGREWARLAVASPSRSLAIRKAQKSPIYDGRESARLEVASPSRNLAIRKARQSPTFDGREWARLT